MSCLNEYVDNTQRKSGDFLLKVRLCFYSSMFLFMVVIACISLRIDFSAAEDPVVRQYHYNKWLLITSWFNLLSLAYTPICIYCDWRELHRSDDTKHVKILNQIRYVCFSSLIYPATIFSDTLFWQLWNKDRELVVPPALDELVPLWLHHCLHSVSFGQVLLDLILVPRRRPKNLTFGVSLLTLFLSAYCVVCARSIIKEEHIYPLLRRFTGFNFIPLVLFVSVEHFLFFTTQWFVVDFVWGRRTKFHSVLYPDCGELVTKKAKLIN